MKAEETKRKIFFWIVVFSLILALLLAAFVVPLLQGIKKMSSQILSDKSSMVLLAVQSEQLQEFKQKYDFYKEDLEKISKFFLDPKNPVGLIKFLEKESAESSIDSKISLSEYSKGEDGQFLQISANGNFLNILEFLEKLENGPYLVKIDSISAKKLESGGEFEINADISLEAKVRIR